MSLTRLPYDDKAYKQRVRMSTYPNTKKLRTPEGLHCFPDISIKNPTNWIPFDTKQVHIEGFLTNRDIPLKKYDNVSSCETNSNCMEVNQKVCNLKECNGLENVNSLVENPRSDFRELSTTDILFATKGLNSDNRVDDRLSIDSRRIVSDIHKRFYPKRC